MFDAARNESIGARPAVSLRPLFLKAADIPARYGTVPSLDGLRAFSIAIVLMSHFISGVFPGGFGVLVFFVISGFLISRLLFAEAKTNGSVSIKNFYIRRVLRLYPAVFAYACVVLAYYSIVGLPINAIEPISALFYFANYLYAHYSIIGEDGTMPFGIFWSLSIEEHFYLVFPIIFIVCHKRLNLLLVLTVSICVIPLLLRFVFASLYPDRLNTNFFYFETQFRIDSLAFGVLIAVLCESHRGRGILRVLSEPLPLIIASFAILVSFAYRDLFFRETLRYSVLSAAVATLVIGIVFSERYRVIQALLNSAALIWIGRLSYSLYVWQLLTPYLVHQIPATKGTPFGISLVFVLSFAIAAASYYGFERRFIRLREKFGSGVS